MKLSCYVLAICMCAVCCFPVCAIGQASRVEWSTFDMGFAQSNGGTLLVRSAVGQPFAGYSGGGNSGVQSGFLGDTVLIASLVETSLAELSMAPGWNMVSLPVIPNDARKSALFPTAQSPAFAYELQYVVRDTLFGGIGYWLKFTPPQVIQISGIRVDYRSVHVQTGWNMIGSISMPVPIPTITSDSDGVVLSNFFGYNGAYSIADSILPGKGYWVKSNKSCDLIFSAGVGGAAHGKAVGILPGSDWPPLPPSDEGMMPALPREFALEQAFPNPFNPSTTIRYQLPADSKVTLRIYNVLGQVVETLQSKVEAAGYKQAIWNASAYPSGVYFYRLESTTVAQPGRTFSSVKKVVLAK